MQGIRYDEKEVSYFTFICPMWGFIQILKEQFHHSALSTQPPADGEVRWWFAFIHESLKKKQKKLNYFQ